MKSILQSLVLGAALALSLFTTSRVRAADASSAPVVQIAILLDTSGSMQGLIEQAKGQLWKIVNEFINAQQNGKQPALEVELREYGKNPLSANTGYIRLIAQLPNDLDKISEELIKLQTSGGDE